MENLNAEQVKKALEFCANWDITTECKGCPYEDKCRDNDITKDALALINSQEQRIGELAEENERLSGAVKQYEEERKYHFEMSRARIAEAKADTVRKMQELIKERCIKGGIYPAFVASTIDQIAREMLEGENNE